MVFKYLRTDGVRVTTIHQNRNTYYLYQINIEYNRYVHKLINYNLSNTYIVIILVLFTRIFQNNKLLSYFDVIMSAWIIFINN